LNGYKRLSICIYALAMRLNRKSKVFQAWCPQDLIQNPSFKPCTEDYGWRSTKILMFLNYGVEIYNTWTITLVYIQENSMMWHQLRTLLTHSKMDIRRSKRDKSVTLNMSKMSMSYLISLKIFLKRVRKHFSQSLWHSQFLITDTSMDLWWTKILHCSTVKCQMSSN
jgi:hypothetical protein